MKKLFLVFLFPLLSQLSMAQIHSKDNVIRGFDGIKYAFINNYKPNIDSAKSTCWKGCVFIRFNINNQHQLTNVTYTATTPIFIKDGIAKVITIINQQGVNIDQVKNLPGRTYILPLMITNNAGCGFMTGWENNDYQSKLDEKTKLMYEKRQERYDQLGNSIQNLINFGDNEKLNFIDCILLKSIVMPLAMN